MKTPASTIALGLVLGLAVTASLPVRNAHSDDQSILVSVSAFNSVAGQTDRQPSVGAWGDRLEPGMKAIAVSRDLIALGLTHGTRVRIEGLPGEYVVRDKMARRWKNKIDVYMGHDVKAARKWGVRKLRIHWTPKPVSKSK